jgi:hypothetical protein
MAKLSRTPADGFFWYVTNQCTKIKAYAPKKVFGDLCYVSVHELLSKRPNDQKIVKPLLYTTKEPW